MTSESRRRHRRRAPEPVRGDPRRLSALAVLAGVSALGAVAGPVAGSETVTVPEVSTLVAPEAAAFSTGLQQEQRAAAVDGVSRDQDRGAPQAPVTAAPEVATPEVVSPLSVPASTTAYAQDDTVARSEPASAADTLVEIERGAPVAVTGRTEDGWVEVVLDGAVAWVAADDVADTKPPAEIETAAGPVPADVSGTACSSGNGVESGLSSNTIAVHRAVCAAFPGLVYGGLRPGDSGEHGSGLALDIMVSGSKGDAVAAYLQEHATELGIDNLIWKQRIWFVGKPFGSWKGMEDRGSVTANHFDHVHVGTR